MSFNCYTQWYHFVSTRIKPNVFLLISLIQTAIASRFVVLLFHLSIENQQKDDNVLLNINKRIHRSQRSRTQVQISIEIAICASGILIGILSMQLSRINIKLNNIITMIINLKWKYLAIFARTQFIGFKFIQVKMVMWAIEDKCSARINRDKLQTSYRRKKQKLARMWNLLVFVARSSFICK